ncbi:acetylglutamate kinase [Desulfarculus baarsii DSM 2075]|uniref:Acetylglutamate kinase n=1 Tax=Desulfarculus baarsii (strain ATCC 33931 / DSM 2075 / LMG 7858 / VKM B-1802 / 2st14) TaxID=644282 RepID=E1QI56_DESB2|nr:acetylglutamate kinase [Desulfarculus baarsii]ADK85249.1 acetylglutamate kinase [Desulfarculus baarsii DSM 2075]
MTTISPSDRGRTLIEALPYINRFAGQTVVIKYGGHAMKDEALKKSFALNVILLRAVGIYPVVVHGGGPQIGQLLDRLSIDCRFVDGMRVTSPEVMNVVQMVLVGQVNTGIVGLINANGGRAVGLNGHDGGLIQASRMTLQRETGHDQPPEIVDLGLVGKVDKVNPQVLHSLEHGNFIPVIAPVGVGPEGESLNINADLVASAVAAGLRASKLILLTDTPGVMDAGGKLLHELTAKEAKLLQGQGVITGGMIPKVNCCLQALERGVERAHIIDGRVANALLLEIFSDQGVGTIFSDR